MTWLWLVPLAVASGVLGYAWSAQRNWTVLLNNGCTKWVARHFRTQEQVDAYTVMPNILRNWTVVTIPYRHDVPAEVLLSRDDLAQLGVEVPNIEVSL